MNETDALNEAIIELQAKRTKQLFLLKEQFHHTYESLKPINLIKGTLAQVSASPEIIKGIMDNAIGIGTGLLSKKLLFGSSRNPVKKLLGTMVQIAITNIVSKRTDFIKATGQLILMRMIKHRREPNKDLRDTGNDLFI